MSGTAGAGNSLLIRGGLVLSMVPGAKPEQSDVRILDDRIVQIGQNLSHDGPEIDATGHVVMPGFIDASRHAWQALGRGLCGDATIRGYFQIIRGMLATIMTPADVRLSTHLAMLEAIDAGVTTVFDFANYVPTPDHAIAMIEGSRASGIRTRFAPAFNSTPSDSSAMSTLDGRVALLEDLASELSDSASLVTLACATSDVELVGVERIHDEMAAARDLGLRITLNCAPVARSGPGEVTLLKEAGLLGSDLLLVHLVGASRDELDDVRSAGASAVVCPGTTFMLGGRVPSTLRLLRAGLRPAIGSDVAAAFAGDARAQAALALQVARFEASQETNSGDSALAPTCEQMISAVSAWGAEAVGLEDEVGTLAPGKRADLIMIDASAPNLSPIHDVCSSLLLQANPGNVKTVIIDGVIRKHNGVLCGAVDDIFRRARESGEDLAARAGAQGGWTSGGASAWTR